MSRLRAADAHVSELQPMSEVYRLCLRVYVLGHLPKQVSYCSLHLHVSFAWAEHCLDLALNVVVIISAAL